MAKNRKTTHVVEKPALKTYSLKVHDGKGGGTEYSVAHNDNATILVLLFILLFIIFKIRSKKIAVNMTEIKPLPPSVDSTIKNLNYSYTLTPAKK